LFNSAASFGSAVCWNALKHPAAMLAADEKSGFFQADADNFGKTASGLRAKCR
jgi:hypothetical protein